MYAVDLSEAGDPEARDLEARGGDRHKLDAAGNHHAVAAVLEPGNSQAGSGDYHNLDAAVGHDLPRILARLGLGEASDPEDGNGDR